jgi:hypothetical protein
VTAKIELGSQKEFGHLCGGVWFRSLCIVRGDGITFRGKTYKWHEVRDVSVVSPLQPFLLAGLPFGKPRATVKFSDGVSLKLDARTLSERGRKSRVRFWSGVSESYLDFLELLSEGVGKPIAP